MLLQKLGLRQPANGTARTLAEAEAAAERIGYPVVIRPSYVLGGRAMRIVYDRRGAGQRYMRDAVAVTGNNPVLIDRYLSDATEVDVDCLADGKDVFVAGIMEHIEEAGIHSGDSACSLPPFSLDPDVVDEIKRQTEMLARALKVVGPDERAVRGQGRRRSTSSRSIRAPAAPCRSSPRRPASRSPRSPRASWRAKALASFKLVAAPARSHVAVKEAVFPFARFPGVDILLGPEMKSTGEVMGIDVDFRRAFAKSQLGAGMRLPSRRHRVPVGARCRQAGVWSMWRGACSALGFKVIATQRHRRSICAAAGMTVGVVNKVQEGRPHCVDAMLSGQVQLVVNTTDERAGAFATVSRSAAPRLTHNISHYTTVAGARAAVDAIEALRAGTLDVAPLQSYL